METSYKPGKCNVFCGPYGPPCGEPSYRCNACGGWDHDDQAHHDYCEKCGFDGSMEPALYRRRTAVLRDHYPNLRVEHTTTNGTAGTFRRINLMLTPSYGVFSTDMDEAIKLAVKAITER